MQLRTAGEETVDAIDEQRALIEDIETFCRRHGMAESTFGKQVVNDGKFVGRLRDGKRVTTVTVARVRRFLTERAAQPARGAPLLSREAMGARVEHAMEHAGKSDQKTNFRFYDNRQKYLMFVNTCSEKFVVAERVGMELEALDPQPPALRVFDAGMGDGSVLTNVMRHMHRRYPNVPFFIVGKEISLEDVRLSLEKMADRFFEHPATIVVATNMYYTEAPSLVPRTLQGAASLNWIDCPLTGSSSYEFSEQIAALQDKLAEGWRVKASAKTGNPIYVRPSVVVMYRADHKFILDQIIPKPAHTPPEYDLIIASQPYRARMSVEFKAEKVLAPLAERLAPGGRLIGIHSHGHDPGLEIIRRVWPGEDPFQTNRHDLLKALKRAMGKSRHDLAYNTYADKRAIFRYDMHTLPSEVGESIGTSTVLAAWNAAIYVAQIEDERLEGVITDGTFLEATRSVLNEYGGLWFYDESYVVSRRRR